jgi:hypothetical protein
MVKTVKSMAILDNEHPIVGVVDKMGVAAKKSHTRSTPLYEILDTPLALTPLCTN